VEIQPVAGPINHNFTALHGMHSGGNNFNNFFYRETFIMTPALWLGEQILFRVGGQALCFPHWRRRCSLGV